VSFREIANMIAKKYKISVETRPRTGPMPHEGLRPFDPKNLFTAFPDFKCTSLVDGPHAFVG
jgi:hypothetical protein